MIYLDYNAGAPLLPHVAEHLAKAFSTAGNPSSVHQEGRRARRRLEAAREQVASLLGCLPREIVFTGSGSEAAAIAVIGAYRARKDLNRRRVVTTMIEHPCVLGAVQLLEREGAEVIRLAPDAQGLVPVEILAELLTDDTALCSLMWINNETGVIQPVEKASRWCLDRGIVFHTDAVQAFGKVSATLREVPADLLSFSAHKLGGPSGVGVLYNRRGVNVAGLVPGHQENGRRGGTQSVPLAESLALALDHATRDWESESLRLAVLRDRFEAQMRTVFPTLKINGSEAPQRVASTSNICFSGCDGEAALVALDLAGICVSAGAACASGSMKPSHVLMAMGLSSAEANATLRFSFGTNSTQAEVEAVVAALIPILKSCTES
jgi:cysteine desulfurase